MLWHAEPVPEGLLKNWARFKTFTGSAPEVWAFWLRWYEGMLKGQPLDWDLQEMVALIPEDDWEKGPEHIAEMIREIEANWAYGKSRIKETLVLDENTLKFSAKPLVASNSDRLARHLSRVEDALDDMIALGGNNGLTEATPEYRIITRLVAKYSVDPERIAFDLTDVNHSIARQIKVGEYADDEPIRLLQAANAVCVSTICDMEPEVAEELAREYPQEPAGLDEEGVLVLEEAMRISADTLDEPAAETTVEDRAEILFGEVIDAAKENLPDGPRRMAVSYRSIVLRRQISRLSQQANEWTKVPKLAKHYDSDQSKAAGVIARYGSVSDLLWAAVIWLWRLVGGAG